MANSIYILNMNMLIAKVYFLSCLKKIILVSNVPRRLSSLID